MVGTCHQLKGAWMEEGAYSLDLGLLEDAGDVQQAWPLSAASLSSSWITSFPHAAAHVVEPAVVAPPSASVAWHLFQLAGVQQPPPAQPRNCTYLVVPLAVCV